MTMMSLFAEGSTSCENVIRNYSSLLVSDPPIRRSLTVDQNSFLKSRGIDPTEYHLVNEGSEGLILLSLDGSQVTKVFKSQQLFHDWKKLHETLSGIFEEAGFKCIQPSLIDSQNFIVVRPWVSGVSVEEMSTEFLHKDRELWNELFLTHEKKFQALKARIQSSGLIFHDDSYGGSRGYFHILHGSFEIEGHSYWIHLHGENVMLSVDAKNSISWTIIDIF